MLLTGFELGLLNVESDALAIEPPRHPKYRSFYFPLPIEFFEILKKYKTSYTIVVITVRENIFEVAEQQFFGSIKYNFFLQRFVPSLLSGNWPNWLLFGLEVYSHNGPHWHRRLGKNPTKCLNLFQWNFASARFVNLVVWESACVTVQCITTANNYTFPEGRAPKPPTKDDLFVCFIA